MPNTYNLDVYRTADHLSKMRVEFHKSQSSGWPGAMKVYDRTRAGDYIQQLNEKVEKMMKGIELDLVEDHPNPIAIPELPALTEVNNPEIKYFMLLCEKAWHEVVNSQSSRDSGKLFESDYNRIKLLISKMQEHLDYLEKCKCGDWPESSPNTAMTGDGSKGV